MNHELGTIYLYNYTSNCISREVGAYEVHLKSTKPFRFAITEQGSYAPSDNLMEADYLKTTTLSIKAPFTLHLAGTYGDAQVTYNIIRTGKG